MCHDATLGIWTFTLLRLEQERQLVVQHASVSQRNLAEIISQNLRRLLDSSVQYAHILENRSHPDTSALVENLPLLIGGDRAFNRPALFDTSGKRLDAASATQISPDLRQEIRLLTQKIREKTDSGIVIGMPSGAPEEMWQVPLLLPVKGVGKHKPGILVLHLDLGIFVAAISGYRDRPKRPHPDIEARWNRIGSSTGEWPGNQSAGQK